MILLMTAMCVGLADASGLKKAAKAVIQAAAKAPDTGRPTVEEIGGGEYGDELVKVDDAKLPKRRTRKSELILTLPGQVNESDPLAIGVAEWVLGFIRNSAIKDIFGVLRKQTDRYVTDDREQDEMLREQHPGSEEYLALLEGVNPEQMVGNLPIVGEVKIKDVTEAIERKEYFTSMSYTNLLTTGCSGFTEDVQQQILNNFKRSKLFIAPIVKIAFYKLRDLREVKDKSMLSEEVVQMTELAEILANYLTLWDNPAEKQQILDFFESFDGSKHALSQDRLSELLAPGRLQAWITMDIIEKGLDEFITRIRKPPST